MISERPEWRARNSIAHQGITSPCEVHKDQIENLDFYIHLAVTKHNLQPQLGWCQGRSNGKSGYSPPPSDNQVCSSWCQQRPHREEQKDTPILPNQRSVSGDIIGDMNSHSVRTKPLTYLSVSGSRVRNLNIYSHLAVTGGTFPHLLLPSVRGNRVK